MNLVPKASRRPSNLIIHNLWDLKGMYSFALHNPPRQFPNMLYILYCIKKLLHYFLQRVKRIFLSPPIILYLNNLTMIVNSYQRTVHYCSYPLYILPRILFLLNCIFQMLLYWFYTISYILRSMRPSQTSHSPFCLLSII